MHRASLRQVDVTGAARRPASDAEWAVRIQEGDYAAFAALFEAHYEELVHFARSFTRRDEVAEDLIQDVFLNIWTKREAWNPRGTLRTYLYGAARNHCLMYLRHQKVERRWQQSEPGEGAESTAHPEHDLRASELTRELQRAIDALPERRRLVFILSRQQGLTYAEIAALLDISTNTVEVQMVRALKALREHLAAVHRVGAPLQHEPVS